jgi:hypothetical protein
MIPHPYENGGALCDFLVSRLLEGACHKSSGSPLANPAIGPPMVNQPAPNILMAVTVWHASLTPLSFIDMRMQLVY